MFAGSRNHIDTPYIFRLNWDIKFCWRLCGSARYMAFWTANMMGDFCEEDGKELGEETGGDEKEAGEQPAMEPVAMVGKDV
jgi:hypothetical protein